MPIEKKKANFSIKIIVMMGPKVESRRNLTQIKKNDKTRRNINQIIILYIYVYINVKKQSLFVLSNETCSFVISFLFILVLFRQTL